MRVAMNSTLPAARIEDALRQLAVGEELQRDRERVQFENEPQDWLANFYRRDRIRLLELAIVANHNAARATALLAAVENLYSGDTRAEVVAAIEDIVLNVIGAEHFAIVESGTVPVTEDGAMTVHVPLRWAGRIVGVITIAGKDFSPLDFELFDVLSRHAARALHTR